MGLALEPMRKKRRRDAPAQCRRAASGSHWIAARLGPHSAMTTQRKLSIACWRRGELKGPKKGMLPSGRRQAEASPGPGNDTEGHVGRLGPARKVFENKTERAEARCERSSARLAADCRPCGMSNLQGKLAKRKRKAISTSKSGMKKTAHLHQQ